MNLNMKDKIIQLVFTTRISNYQIYKATGIPQDTLSKLKSGQRDIGNLTIKTGEQLAAYYDRLVEDEQISFDSDLISKYVDMLVERDNESKGV